MKTYQGFKMEYMKESIADRNKRITLKNDRQVDVIFLV